MNNKSLSSGQVAVAAPVYASKHWSLASGDQLTPGYCSQLRLVYYASLMQTNTSKHNKTDRYRDICPPRARRFFNLMHASKQALKSEAEFGKN